MNRISRRDFLEAFAAMGLALPVTSALFDVKHPRGLDFNHVNSPTPQKYLIETMGGGVALLDYNNDGLLDIFLVNSGQAYKSHAPAGDLRPPRSAQLESPLPPESGWQLHGRHQRSRAGRMRVTAITAWASRWAITTTTAFPTST